MCGFVSRVSLAIVATASLALATTPAALAQSDAAQSPSPTPPAEQSKAPGDAKSAEPGTNSPASTAPADLSKATDRVDPATYVPKPDAAPKAPADSKAARDQPATKAPAPRHEEDRDEPHYQPPGPAKSVEVASFYLKRKSYPAALSRFKEAIATDPHFAAAYLGLGKTYEKMGLRQKALDAYLKYLDALPSDKDAQDAKDAQRAVARLEQELGKPARPKPTAAPSSH